MQVVPDPDSYPYVRHVAADAARGDFAQSFTMLKAPALRNRVPACRTVPGRLASTLTSASDVPTPCPFSPGDSDQSNDGPDIGPLTI